MKRKCFLFYLFAVIIFMMSAAEAALPPSAAHYTFNAGSNTTVIDVSGNSNHGSIAGATPISGQYGGALRFDGNANTVSIADAASLDLSNQLSLLAWVRSAPGSGYDIIMSKGDWSSAYSLFTDDENDLGFFLFTEQSPSPAFSLVDNAWTHIALTYDGVNATLYINGFPVGDFPRTGIINSNDDPLYLGSFGNGDFLAGDLDDVRIYNEALDAAQVQEAMDNLGDAALAIEATPNPINSGDTATLTWASVNTTTCTASGDWSGAQTTSGTVPISPTTTSTYILNCDSEQGQTISAQVTVTVEQNPDPGPGGIDLTTVGDNTWVRVDEGGVATAWGILSYSGAWFDPVYRQFCIFGGGHWDYSGNDVWCFDTQRQRWTQMYEPDEGNLVNGQAGAYAYSDDVNYPGALFMPEGEPIENTNPFSKHTYDQMEFVDGLGPIVWGGFSWGEVAEQGWCPLCTDTWAFRFPSANWHYLYDGSNPSPSVGTGVGASAYSTLEGRLYSQAVEGNIHRYNPVTNQWEALPVTGAVVPGYDEAIVPTFPHGVMEYDPNRNVFYYFGGDGYIDQDPNAPNYLFMRYDPTTQSWTRLLPTGQGPDDSIASLTIGPGLAFDTFNDVLLVYRSGYVWAYDPNANSWETASVPGDGAISVDNINYNDESQIYGRFRYDDVNNGVWYHSLHDGRFETWFYRYRNNLNPPAPVVSMIVDPPRLASAGTVNVAWFASNATDCVASGNWSGDQDTDGSRNIQLSSNTASFRLDCTGPGGSGSRTVTVTPSNNAQNPLATVTLSASPSTVVPNERVKLNWSTTNAVSCTASDAWQGARDLNGSEDVFPDTTRTYTLTCFNADNIPSTPESVTVTVNPPNPSPELVAHYRFEAITDNLLLDESGNDNTGTVNGATIVSGQIGNALSFDGNDFVEIPDSASLDLSNQMTFAAWVRSPLQTGYNILLSKGDWSSAYSVFINADNNIGFFIAGASEEVPNASIGNNTWSHVAVTYDGTVIRIYLNGTLLPNEYPVTAPINNNDAPLYLGTYGPGDFLNGELDDLRLYNTALTQADIVAIMNDGSVSPAPGLSFSAAPATINPGMESILTWSGSNVDACTASGAWSGNVAIADTQAVRPDQTSVYTLTCDGSNGTPVAESVTVTVEPPPTNSDVIRVGPNQTVTTLSAAAQLAQNGNVIEIDAGEYLNDVSVWTQDNIIIRGVNGRVHLRATEQIVSNNKAILVIAGDNYLIENVEFSGASVAEENGAGIRAEGRNLTIRNCYFHDNENGILGSADGTLSIENSEFYNNGFGDGQTHNIYIVGGDRFILKNSISHHALVGHNVKTRAQENFILYNKILDQATGTASYSIDISNGGLSYIIGNAIQQGPNTDNSGTMIAYALEGTSNTIQELFVSSNTVVNDAANPTAFIAAAGGTAGVVVNNLFVGEGYLNAGNANILGESGLLGVDTLPRFVDRANYDYRLTGNSPAIDLGIDPGLGRSYSLTPAQQYIDTARSQSRRQNGNALDAGAFEFGAQGTAMRFFGNVLNDVGRVMIPLDDPPTSADIGAEDFTLEFWMRANADDNTGAANQTVVCNNLVNDPNGYSWIYGNIVFDRDRFEQAPGFGVATINDRIAIGVLGPIGDTYTLCNEQTNVEDGQWHHIAIQRQRSSGNLSIYVDGRLEAFYDAAPMGDISYPDGGEPLYTCDPQQDPDCWDNDPFLVIAAEKHNIQSNGFNGYLDEVRFSNTLRYAGSTFAVPVSPFLPDANTLALYHFEERIGGMLLDDSDNATHGQINFGSWQNTPFGPVWDSENPFGSDAGGEPWVSIMADATQITAGQTVMLEWYSSNASSCTASGGGSDWSGPVATSDQAPQTPMETTTYTITCSNGNQQSVPASVTVIVSPATGSSPNLVAHYTFDEGSNNILTDNSGNNNHGDITNPEWIVGRYGNALSFNGNDQSVTIPDSASLDLVNAMTITAWVRSAEQSNYDTLIAKGAWNNAYSVYLDPDNSIGVFVAGQADPTGGSIGNNQWAHIAVVFDGADVMVYRDGNLVAGPLARSTAITVNNSPLYLGRGAEGDYLNGSLDEVRIYNRALDATEINNVMNNLDP